MGYVKQFIEIPRASEELILELIRIGVIVVGDDGLHCRDTFGEGK